MRWFKKNKKEITEVSSEEPRQMSPEDWIKLFSNKFPYPYFAEKAFNEKWKSWPSEWELQEKNIRDGEKISLMCNHILITWYYDVSIDISRYKTEKPYTPLVCVPKEIYPYVSKKLQKIYDTLCVIQEEYLRKQREAAQEELNKCIEAWSNE